MTGIRSSEAEARGVTVVAEGRRYAVRRADAEGFEVAHDLRLPRGLVALHEGGRLTRHALVVAEGPRGDAMRYVYKRSTAARRAAPVDYELAPA